MRTETPEARAFSTRRWCSGRLERPKITRFKPFSRILDPAVCKSCQRGLIIWQMRPEQPYLTIHRCEAPKPNLDPVHSTRDSVDDKPLRVFLPHDHPDDQDDPLNQSFWHYLVFCFAFGAALSAPAQEANQFEFRLHGAVLGDVTFFNPRTQGAAPTSSNSSGQIQSEQTADLWASGKTRGMVHWFKRYEATFRSTSQPNGVQVYRVIAVDADVPETRHIEFPTAAGSSPKVIDFSDRTQAEPLQIDPLLDQDRIDPLSVLQKILRQVDQTQTCDAAYRVYDGKRRYSVLTQGPLTDQPVTPDQVDAALSLGQAPPTLKCQITLRTPIYPETGNSQSELASRASTMSTQPRQSAGFWPFKKQEQTMTIEFKRFPAGYRFSAFNINSPFGTIKGRPAS